MLAYKADAQLQRHLLHVPWRLCVTTQYLRGRGLRGSGRTIAQ